MNPELTAFFTAEFIKRGLDVNLIPNILLTVEGNEDYQLDCIDYELFANSVYPDQIDEILDLYLQEHF